MPAWEILTSAERCSLISDACRRSRSGLSGKAGLGLSVLNAGYLNKPRGTFLHGRILPVFAWVFLKKGNGILRTGSAASYREYTVSAGSLFFLYPGIWHAYGSFSSRWTEYWNMFDGYTARFWLASGLLNPEKPVFDLSELPEVAALCGKNISSSGIWNADQSRSVINLFSLITQLPHIPFPSFSDTYAEKIRNAAAVLEKGDTDSRHVRGILTSSGLEYEYARKLFTQIIGQPPGMYAEAARLKKAAYHLLQRNISITQAAYSHGFDDPYYFSRRFTKFFGVSPKLWKMQGGDIRMCIIIKCALVPYCL